MFRYINLMLSSFRVFGFPQQMIFPQFHNSIFNYQADMKTLQNSNNFTPKLSNNSILSRSNSGKFRTTQSKSTASDNFLLDSDLVMKNSLELRHNDRQKPTTYEYHDHYQFFNVKRPRIKNVNGFLKIKRSQKIYCTNDRNKSKREISKAKIIPQKSSKIKLNPSVHHVSSQENLNNCRSASPIICQSQSYRLIRTRNKLKQDFRNLMRKTISIEQTIKEQQAKKELQKITYQKILARLSKMVEQEEKRQRLQLGNENKKSVLEETSDSGSSKDIIDEYGLMNSFKY